LDEPEEYIDFMAKYKDWISIKRIGIRENTVPAEVVNYLAGVRTTIDSKAYPMLQIKTSMLDAYAAKVCEGLKKNYGSLASAFSKMDSPETKKVIVESCSKELAPVAETYLLNKVITTLGFDVSINQPMMSKIYPELKLPKTPGLGRKGKKAKTEDE
jgi:hypothetical protein